MVEGVRRRRIFVGAVSALVLLFALVLAFRAGPAPAEPPPGLTAYYPDLPDHRPHPPEPGEGAPARPAALLQRDRERRAGPVGPPGPSTDSARDQTTTAFQQIRSNNAQHACGTQPKQVTACYKLLHEEAASIFEYHPEHHHWHTADVARFEVRRGDETGEIVGGNSVKVGFCLVEVYRIAGNAGRIRTFWDCFGDFQGLGAGWIDQYHQATPGQELDLTGVADGENYFLVSTTDPEDAFLETDETNNTAWVRFTLSTHSNGRRKVVVTGHSLCDSPGLCGVGAPNRG